VAAEDSRVWGAEARRNAALPC